MIDRPKKTLARVLYVDDNPHDVALVRHALQKQKVPIDLSVAQDWDTLEQKIATGTYDAVLADFNVLGYTGLEIVELLRERLQDVPVVLLTGTGSEEVAAEALRRGVDDYIIKTSDQIRHLPRRLKLLIEKRRLEKERAQAARALISASVSYRELIRTSPDAMVIFGANQTIRFANPAAETMFGGDMTPLARRVFEGRNVPDGGPIDIEIRQPDGSLRLGEQRTARINWEGEPCILAVVRDVTERAKLLAEQKSLARASSTLLRSDAFTDVLYEVLEQLTQVVGATLGQVSRRTRDNMDELLVLSETGKRLDYGGMRSPIAGLKADAYESPTPVFNNDFQRDRGTRLLPPDHPRLDNVLLCPVRARDGVWGLIGLANKPGGFDQDDARIATAFANLVSFAVQRERNTEALRESESRFKAVFENAMDGILLTDQETGRTLLANQAMADILGLSPEEVHRRTLSELLPPEALETSLSAGTKGERQGPTEILIKRPDGQPRNVEVQASRLRLGDSEVLIGTFRDVTDRKKLVAAMAQSDRLATVGMLAAAVAHEINNPLSYLLYNLETGVDAVNKSVNACKHLKGLLAERLGQDATLSLGIQTTQVNLEEAQPPLRDALQAAQRIKEISRGLGTFSRVEKPVSQEVDLVAAVKHAVTIAQNEIKYRARLILDLEPVPPVMASEGRLAQVALNLLVNAAQAIDEGYVEGNRIHVRVWSDADHVWLEVSDTGQGIPADRVSRIFDPFYSTKPVGIGSGLGLSICKTIVTEYGGDISVHSTPGEGSRFVVRLPRHRPSGERRSAPPRREETSPVTTGGRVLVVDDELAVRRILERVLGRDHEVVTAPSGEAARAILETDQAFHAILCDMMMPGGSGMDLHRWLSEAHPALAGCVIFMTGGAFTPRAREYLARLDSPRLDKPFDMAELRRLVSRVVRTSLAGRPNLDNG